MNKTFCDRCEKQIAAGTQLPSRKLFIHSDIDPYGKGNQISGLTPYIEICTDCFDEFGKMFKSWRSH